MESETLSHTHLITNIEKWDKEYLSDRYAFFSFAFDINNEQQLSNTFQFIFLDQNKRPFSLTIFHKIEKWTDKNWIDKLCLILSHPNYLKYQNKQFLAVNSSSGLTGRNDFLNFLSVKLKDQGFKEVTIIDLNDPHPETNDPPFSFHSTLTSENFYEWYLRHLLISQSLFNIFLDNENNESISTFFDLKSDAEKRLKIEQPLIYAIIKNLQIKSSEAAKYKSLMDLMTEDLSSRKAYLDFVLGKFEEGNTEQIDLNPVMKIKKFYYQEYEILPLWYKRFGHILKVFMGKRTFRSLFSDNTKKYKD